jgi:hypothetical protein
MTVMSVFEDRCHAVSSSPLRRARSPDLIGRELKSDLFISVLEGWGYLLDHLVLEQTFADSVDRLIEGLSQEQNWSAEGATSQSELLSLTLPAFVVFSGMSTTLTSRKLSRAYERAINSDRLNESVFGASMAALFAFDLASPGWAQAFAKALSSHGALWVTADFYTSSRGWRSGIRAFRRRTSKLLSGS